MSVDLVVIKTGDWRPGGTRIVTVSYEGGLYFSKVQQRAGGDWRCPCCGSWVKVLRRSDRGLRCPKCVKGRG